MMTINILLREVEDGDIPVFFLQQLDPEATQMAGFPVRSEDEFHSHWRRIRSDENNILRTILFEGKVAGNIVSWEQDDKRQIGYWIGREFWGKGIATQALSLFLKNLETRPIHACVVSHNLASMRVLEKNGFIKVGEEKYPSGESGAEIEESVFLLG
jgi:RimJ/RimL family protein N-acetyltransferase